MTPAALKSARLALGLSQAALGEALGLLGDRKAKARTVRRWEQSERPISGPVALAVRHLLAGAGASAEPP